MKYMLVIALGLITTPAVADTYILYNKDHRIVNVIKWDGVTPYTPPSGLTIAKAPNGAIGDSVDVSTGTVVKQPPPPPSEEQPSLMERVKTLEDELKQIKTKPQ